MAKFKAALDSGKFKDRVQKDSAEGMKVGANGTPTFFINGNKVEGAQPFDAFKSVIDRELAKK
jgi:protein-disulfide isomerase